MFTVCLHCALGEGTEVSSLNNYQSEVPNLYDFAFVLSVGETSVHPSRLFMEMEMEMEMDKRRWRWEMDKRRWKQLTRLIVESRFFTS